MKRIVNFFVVFAFLFALAGCHRDPQPTGTAPSGNQFPEAYLQMIETEFQEYLSAAESVRIYQVGVDGNESFTYTVGGKEQSMSGAKLWYTAASQEDVAAVVALFNGWKITDHLVPAGDILDSILDIYILLDSGLTIGYSTSSTGWNCYGHIDGRAYYLPSAFGAFIDGIVKG